MFQALTALFLKSTFWYLRYTVLAVNPSFEDGFSAGNKGRNEIEIKVKGEKGKRKEGMGGEHGESPDQLCPNLSSYHGYATGKMTAERTVLLMMMIVMIKVLTIINKKKD